MWLSFALALLIGCAVLALPGYLLLRALRLSRFASLCAAPVASVSVVCLLSLVLAESGIACNGLLVGAGGMLAGAFAYAASRAMSTRPGTHPVELDVLQADPLRFRNRRLPFDWTALACYVAFAGIVCGFVFIPCLTGSPDAIFCRWDNQTHLNMVRSFMDSGSWSLLHTGVYIGVDASAIPYANITRGFYPAGWHILCATICSMAGVSVPLGANALNALISALVYPMGMLLLNKALFPQNRKALAAGAVITMSFTAFPWALFVKGPLYPNLLAYALLPAALGVFLLYFERGLVRGKLPGFVASCALWAFALAITQTNTLFSAFLFLAAYGGHYIDRHLKATGRAARFRAIIGIVYFAAVFGFWTLCYNLPILQGVVRYNWGAAVSLPFAVLMAGSFAMPSFMPEFVLALVALVGLICCLRRKRLWIIVPALVMAVGFVLDRSTEGMLKHFISGFWYTDAFRTAAGYAIFVAPIACLGLAAVVDWVQGRNFRLLSRFNTTRRSFGLVMAAFCLITFCPSFTLPIDADGLEVETAFGSLHSRFLASYRTDAEQVLSSEEREFIRSALAEMPDGALVINQPHDGSVFAYAAEGLNTLYRSGRAGNQTGGSRLIRTSLQDYYTDESVRAAVESTGAEYLLQLDHEVPYDEGTWLPQYDNPESWKGIDAVGDDTPGFELLLSEGDMRLYKIREAS